MKKALDRPTVIRVLDASALLALLHQEKGADKVRSILEGSLISSVNWSEVLQKLIAHSVDISNLSEDLNTLGVQITPFTSKHAQTTAELWTLTNKNNLSLADRACLALAKEAKAVAITADRAWSELAVGIDIEIIR